MTRQKGCTRTSTLYLGYFSITGSVLTEKHLPHTNSLPSSRLDLAPLSITSYRLKETVASVMADQFIGLTILATLNEPPNTQVRGLVTAVVEQQLTLSKGMAFGSIRRLPVKY